MTKKLDKEHLDKIQLLRDSFTKVSSILGNIYVDEYVMKQQLVQIEAEREKYINEHLSLRQQEQELLEELRNRYGDGEINILDGTFTPAS